MRTSPIKSVAIIGAGPAGAIAAAALDSEDTFEVIRVFERRHVPGGIWIYDPSPENADMIYPGKLPPEIDTPLQIPKHLPGTTSQSTQHRYESSPIYPDLTTNIPDIAMSYSDRRFPYGPFVPHWIPRQYIENYFSWHQTYSRLVLNTTVEDLSRAPVSGGNLPKKWKLTLRRPDPARGVDEWWEETFDAVILANGHFSIPFIPEVKGLEQYMNSFPGRVTHSKSYRTASPYANQRVLVIGNSASGHDIAALLVQSGRLKLPVYQSRRSKAPWDGDEPPEGIEWKPVISEYQASTNELIFEDGTRLTGIDAVIYCTGYRPSFPFWNARANGGPLYSYDEARLLGSYQHTFFQAFPRTLGIVGFPRALTFRSFEYQAVALARLFAGRVAVPLPPRAEQERWERERIDLVQHEGRRFHELTWAGGEQKDFLQFLFDMSGLPTLKGLGRYPPVLDEETSWALKNIRKYPVPDGAEHEGVEGGWVIVDPPMRQNLARCSSSCASKP